jgi:hypothetical protein
MPEATAQTFNLEGKSAPELEARRREIIEISRTKYKGYDDPDLPEELLGELAVVTSMLRRGNAGPPKAEKKTSAKVSKAKATVDDLMV